MITYVNTVLVGTGAGASNVVTSISNDNVGKYVIMDVDSGELKAYNATAGLKRIKVGLITSKTVKDMTGTAHNIVKWSNVINRDDIKSFNYTEYSADSEDTVYLNFKGATLTELAKGNKRVLVRITYKDLPTRYRKWTDTYEYVTAYGDTAKDIAVGIANVINKAWKRSRVEATVGEFNSTSASADATVGNGTYKYYHADSNWNNSSVSANDNGVKIVALPYNDDNAVDTINVAGKVRFSVNVYFTDPEAAGFASKNKYTVNGLEIVRVPGNFYTAAAKLVRDREAQAMGYEGILNRGEGTWPIIKPDMNVNLDAHYDAITLEFENMYRSADDLFRKTKQTLEIYDYYTSHNLDDTNLYTAITSFLAGGKTAYDAAQDVIIAGKADAPASNNP